MALSDPSNVRVGLARKQALLQRLAAQLGAKGGARAAGNGSQFNSAVNLRTGGPARLTLPFALPNGKVRPAGFDPDPNGGNSWAAPQNLAVTPSGPPAGAGGGSTLNNTTPMYDVAPSQMDAYSGTAPASYLKPDGTYGNFEGALPTWESDAPLNSPAPPDPYTLMAQLQMRRIAGTFQAS